MHTYPLKERAHVFVKKNLKPARNFFFNKIIAEHIIHLVSDYNHMIKKLGFNLLKI